MTHISPWIILSFIFLVNPIFHANSDPVLYSDLNCKSGVENLTAFQELMCRVAESPLKIQSKCIPMYWEPQISQVRGAVAFFHGFSACPCVFRVFAKRLQKEGFYVYSFLAPGHGREYGTCISEQECSNGYPVESLPMNSEGYELFVKESNAIFKSELDRLRLKSSSHVIASSGLSFGGSLSAYAVYLGNGMYTHWIPFAPFFGISADGLDEYESKCENDLDFCLHVFLNNSFKSFFSIFSGRDVSIPSSIVDDISILTKTYIHSKGGHLYMRYEYLELQRIVRSLISSAIEFIKTVPSRFLPLLNIDLTWGKKCYFSRDAANRAGFCDFKLRHLFAAHAFAEKSLLLSRFFYNVSSQFILTQRDGITRNSLSNFAAQWLIRSKLHSGVCIYYTNPDYEDVVDENRHGVPHSMIDPSDNMAIPPYYMPWEENYITGVISWLKGESTEFGLQFSLPKADLLYQCVRQPIFSPMPEIFGFAPSGGVMRLAKSLSAFVVTKNVFQDLKRVLHIHSWKLSLARSEMVFYAEATYTIISFAFDLPPEPLELLYDLVRSRNLTSIAGFPIVYLQIDSRKELNYPISIF